MFEQSFTEIITNIYSMYNNALRKNIAINEFECYTFFVERAIDLPD